MNHKKQTFPVLFAIDIALGVFFLLAIIYMYEIRANMPQNGPVSAAISSNQPQPQPLSLILATTSAEQELGLGQRASLPADEGMLFVFPFPSNYGFWMKDMHFPIDMIWMDQNFSITHIASDVSPATYPNVLYPGQNSMYVLETNAGYAEKSDLEVGETLDFVKKSLENSG